MTSSPPKNGSCSGKPVGWWYPDLVSRNPREIRVQMRANAERAKAICETCPVIVECREYALEWELHGIWGGMTEKERKLHRSSHNIQYKRPSLTEIIGFSKDA
jgi:WhiB family redox-sensing transcriptional regulator